MATKIPAFGAAVATGGLIGAACAAFAKPVGLLIDTSLPILRGMAAPALWTAIVAVPLSLALVMAQNIYLKRSLLSFRQALTLIPFGLVTGLIAGGLAQFLYGYASTQLSGATQLSGLVDFATWSLLGGLLGAGMSLFIPNLPKSRATFAGAAGGIAAAWLRLEIRSFLGSEGSYGIYTDLASAAVLGLFLGVLVAWVDTTFREAWLNIIYQSDNVVRTVRLGAEPVTVGNDSSCTAYISSANKISLRYSFAAGSVKCEDLIAGTSKTARNGDSIQLGPILLQVGLAGGGAADAGTAVETFVLKPQRGGNLPLTAGVRLTAKEVPGIDVATGTNLAEVLRNPNDPRVLGLKNLTQRAWKATLVNGTEREVVPGRSLALAAGAVVDFGGTTGTIVQQSTTPPSAQRSGMAWVRTLLVLAAVGGMVARGYTIADNAKGPPDGNKKPEDLTNKINIPVDPIDEKPPELPKIREPEPPKPIDSQPRVKIVVDGDKSRFGVFSTSGNPDDPTDDDKKLTFSTHSSNTVVSIDGDNSVFGGADGKFIESGGDETSKYEYEWEVDGVAVRLKVALVGGEISRRTDVFEVTYELENRDSDAHVVGLRAMIDTLIGDNDGVNFTAGGQSGIISGPKTFMGEQYVPEYIQALEKSDFKNPGVIVRIGIVPPRGEKATRVELTHWPGSDADWDYDKQRAFSGDSAIGLYFDKKELQPGAKRTVGYYYGLGGIAPTKNASMSFVADKPCRSGQKFYVSLLVQNPKAGQRVRLTLPEGLSLAAGEQAEKSLTAVNDYTQLSWLVTTSPSFFGKAEVTAKLLPDGSEGRGDYLVEPREARLILSPPKPPLYLGKSFWASALVQNPRPGQRVELTLPAGVEFMPDHSSSKEVPPAAEGQQHSQVNWLLKGIAQGSGTLNIKLPDEGSVKGATDKVDITILPKAFVGGG